MEARSLPRNMRAEITAYYSDVWTRHTGAAAVHAHAVWSVSLAVHWLMSVRGICWTSEGAEVHTSNALTLHEQAIVASSMLLEKPTCPLGAKLPFLPAQHTMTTISLGICRRHCGGRWPATAPAPVSPTRGLARCGVHA
jgi:hypothetical protein